jgi:hypothetical protein
MGRQRAIKAGSPDRFRCRIAAGRQEGLTGC